MTTKFPSELTALDGIRAELHGYVDSAPRARFHQDGSMVWEFGLRLIDNAATGAAELITLRVPDQRYAQLQNWVIPGRRLYTRCQLRLARWQGSDGQPRARLLGEPLELMPLDERIQGSAPAALDYRQAPASPPTSSGGGSDWAEQLQQELDEAGAAQKKAAEHPRRAPPRARLLLEPATQRRLARRYEEIFGGDAA